MFIRFITTGGTIDKVYFDALSRFEVGDSPFDAILADGMVSFAYDVVPMFRKDSLELTDADREELRTFILNDDADRYVISHGTDTMVETSAVLQSLVGKTIVITGSLSPARFKTTDAIFNVGMAVAAVQASKPGVYIAMSGQVFKADSVRKNRAENRFELLP
ncbi:MAG: asparaginase [Woeseia sp.]|jgi:L-asparaginase|nr:asparaginase [Woeseia sp.]MBT6208496.1 asparaginase [Woeseia sp.]